MNLLFLLKWQSFIGRYRKNGNQPLEDLAKYDYKLEIKYKILIILLYIRLHNEYHMYELDLKKNTFMLLAIENSKKIQFIYLFSF
jgi:hypothetical protein